MYACAFVRMPFLSTRRGTAFGPVRYGEALVLTDRFKEESACQPVHLSPVSRSIYGTVNRVAWFSAFIRPFSTA